MFSGNFEKEIYELELAAAFDTGKKKFKRKNPFVSLSSKCIDSKKTQHFNVTFDQIKLNFRRFNSFKIRNV